MSTDHESLITRRRSLALLGSGAAGVLIAGGASLGSGTARAVADGDDYLASVARACTLSAEQEEGPFYVALDDVRSNIVLGQIGLSLELTITIINSKTCKPLKHAAVDIWHCNGHGVYSDITSEDSSGQKYLRGVQFTDKHGQVHFTTIFPGHYSGRTTHIHARIHISSGDYKSKLVGGHIAHTGQMFTPDAVNAEVYKLSPYDTEAATVVDHAEDRVWTGQHGYDFQLNVEKLGHKLTKGLAASVTMAVDPTATPALIGATSTASPPTGTKP